MSDSAKPRLPIWLIASLMANALLIGLFIGGGLGQKRAGPPVGGPGGEQALIRGIDQAVPEDQRQAVRQAFRRAFEDTRQERVKLRDAQTELSRRLSAEPYDAEAVREAFAEMRSADAVMKARLHDVLANQFGNLTAEQRRAVIEDFRRRPRGRPGRRGDGPPGPRPRRDRD